MPTGSTKPHPVNERSWTLCQRDAFGDSRRCNGDKTRQLRPAQQTVDAIWRTKRRQLRRCNDVEIRSGRRRVCDRIGTTSSTNGRRRPTQSHQRQRGCDSTGTIEGSTVRQRRRSAVAVKHRFWQVLLICIYTCISRYLCRILECV